MQQLSTEEKELLNDFIAESIETLQEVSSLLVSYEEEEDPATRRDIIDNVFRYLHSLKGNSSFFSLDDICHLAHTCENILDDIRHDKLVVSPDIISALLSGTDTLSTLISDLRNGTQSIHHQQLADLTQHIESLRQNGDDPRVIIGIVHSQLKELLPQLGPSQKQAMNGLVNLLANNCAPAQKEPAQKDLAIQAKEANEPRPSKQGAVVSKKQPAQESPSERRVMRIDEDRIDAFLSYVGELVVIGDMFQHKLRQFERAHCPRDLTNGLSQVVGTFHQLSGKLQHAIMSVRTMPAKQLLRKAPKIVRDIATTQGKEIQVVVRGQEIEIDKGYIDLLDAPLVHMIRNAADHGIETPEVRAQKGKPKAGTITISIRIENGLVIFELQDDGAGINRERIAVKARELGLISGHEELHEKALIDCLFTAGVSTAETISDISGRGVGMDVVKRAIEQAGGHISVSSEVDQGSTFTVSLPQSISTQISMGYFIRCGTEHFILDLDCVEETFEHTNGISTCPDGIRILQRHGQSLPVIDIGTFMNVSRDKSPNVVVVVSIQQNKYALLAEDVIGIKQMVKSSLNLPGYESLPFKGVAMQGDGNLALIIDLEKLEASHN